MRIAVDAMGGDHAPSEIVKGALQAAQTFPSIDKLVLVGDQAAIMAVVPGGKLPSNVEIFHCTEVIAMDEAPAQAVKRKKDSSVNRAIDLQKSGNVDAVVSAGNTGAFVVSSTLKLRTLEGVLRPAIAAVMPTQRLPFVLIDAGANVDCETALMGQFAIMGSIYSKVIFERPNPVVGLLSTGSEDSKGSESIRTAFAYLSQLAINFRGNIEGHDMFVGETDVVVCDGFVGNVVLKTSEGAGRAVSHWMKREFKANWIRLCGAFLLQGALRSLKKNMDPEMYGGAPLLGINGVCIKAHGGSRANAIFHAVRVACQSVNGHMNKMITEAVAAMPPVSA